MADLIAIHMHHDDLSITCRTLCEKHYNSLVMDADFYWDMCESHTPDPTCADCDEDEPEYLGDCLICHQPAHKSTGVVCRVSPDRLHIEWVAHIECAMRYVQAG